MNIVGRSEVRVDAFDKATGRTKYYDDLAPKDALLVRIKHSTIAHGFVKSVDISKAEKIPGVVKILTCFDVPDIPFPTAGHPWSMDPSHQDIADRHLLNQHVRYYGDDVCAVIAEDEVAAMQAVRAIEVEYEELPFVLDVQKAMEPGAPQLHEKFPNNILKHTDMKKGDYQAAIREPGLIKVEGWYETPTVQHCHIENHGCFCYEENGRLVVTSSTQIPHIIRRVVGQALGLVGGLAVNLEETFDLVKHRFLRGVVRSAELLRAFEHQVLEVVGQTGGLGRVVLSADADGDVGLDAGRLLIDAHVDLQSIRKGVDPRFHRIARYRFVLVLAARRGEQSHDDGCE